MADATSMSGTRDVRHSYVQDAGQTQSGSQVENFKGTLTPKEGMGDKFSKENMAKVGEGLKDGSIKMLKKTGGGILVGLSVITPKDQSKGLAKEGMKLLGKEENKNWGIDKQKTIQHHAQKMLGSTMKYVGMGMALTGATFGGSAEKGSVLEYGEGLMDRGIKKHDKAKEKLAGPSYKEATAKFERTKQNIQNRVDEQLGRSDPFLPQGDDIPFLPK